MFADNSLGLVNEPHVLIKSNGDYDSSTYGVYVKNDSSVNEFTGISMSREFVIPDMATKIYLSAPKTTSYVLAYGHGIGDDVNDVNAIQEEDKRSHILGKYPINVLKYSTSVYTSKFNIINDNTTDISTGMIHIFGMIDGEVEREYYYRLDNGDKKIPANSSLGISVSSYEPVYSLDWEVGYIDKEEIILSSKKS